MNRRVLTLTIVIAAQCIFLLGMTYKHERTLATGAVVLLETQPVDPRDLLRGDFVILSYKISDVPRNFFGNLGLALTPGTAVWVRLEPRGEFHEVVAASTDVLEPGSDGVVVTGTVEWQSQEVVRVQYGLEKYFVAEGTGNPIGKLTVEASVGAGGEAAIRQVYVDGQPYGEAMAGQRR